MLRAQPQRHRDTETAQNQPPTSQPRRHEDTKTSQSPLDRPARSRPPGGRGPLGRVTSPNASVRRSHSTQRPALSESAGLASQAFSDWDGSQTLALEQARPRRGRRALRVGRGEDRLGRTLAFGADGLRPGCRRSSDRRHFRHTTPGNLADAGFVPLCLLCVLRVFVVATILRSVSSVPLWFVRYLGSSKTLQSRT